MSLVCLDCILPVIYQLVHKKTGNKIRKKAISFVLLRTLSWESVPITYACKFSYFRENLKTDHSKESISFTQGMEKYYNFVNFEKKNALAQHSGRIRLERTFYQGFTHKHRDTNRFKEPKIIRECFTAQEKKLFSAISELN